MLFGGLVGKLRLAERLVKMVRSMYSNARICVRIKDSSTVNGIQNRVSMVVDGRIA